MTTTKKPTEPTTTVYDIYLRNTNTGSDNYVTELAINRKFVDDGTYQAVVEQDGGKYFTDPQGVIVAIFDKRTLVLKPKGSY